LASGALACGGNSKATAALQVCLACLLLQHLQYLRCCAFTTLTLPRLLPLPATHIRLLLCLSHAGFHVDNKNYAKKLREISRGIASWGVETATLIKHKADDEENILSRIASQPGSMRTLSNGLRGCSPLSVEGVEHAGEAAPRDLYTAFCSCYADHDVVRVMRHNTRHSLLSFQLVYSVVFTYGPVCSVVWWCAVLCACVCMCSRSRRFLLP
jgi:hypothetical protein